MWDSVCFLYLWTIIQFELLQIPVDECSLETVGASTGGVQAACPTERIC